jgi:hypothetical protein
VKDKREGRKVGEETDIISKQKEVWHPPFSHTRVESDSNLPAAAFVSPHSNLTKATLGVELSWDLTEVPLS